MTLSSFRGKNEQELYLAMALLITCLSNLAPLFPMRERGQLQKSLVHVRHAITNAPQFHRIWKWQSSCFFVKLNVGRAIDFIRTIHHDVLLWWWWLSLLMLLLLLLVARSTTSRSTMVRTSWRPKSVPIVAKWETWWSTRQKACCLWPSPPWNALLRPEIEDFLASTSFQKVSSNWVRISRTLVRGKT